MSKPKRASKARRKRKSAWFRSIATIPTATPRYDDGRGWLQLVVNPEKFNHPIGGVVVMYSRAGAVRARHRHKDSAHWCHLVSGAMEYHERDPKTGHVTVVPIVSGMSWFTPPRVDHAFVYTQDSVTIVVADSDRDSDSYEKDLIRLPDTDPLGREKRL